VTPLLLGLLLLLVAWATTPLLAAPVLWTAPSLERVGAWDAPGSALSIDLYAAQGETESFQVVVRAEGSPLTNVNVLAPNLGGPEFTLYREHYVYVSGSSDWASNRNHPEGPGWYADALIPFTHPETGADLTGATYDGAPFDVETGRNRPVWVDVYVPRGTAPGVYTGSLVVTSDQGQAAVLVNLTVWNFALPPKPYEKSSILLWTIRSDSATTKELLRHRLMPTWIDASEERALIDTYGLNTTGLGFWSGADGTNCLINSPPSVATIQAAVAQHEPDLPLYAYTADEINPCPNVFETLKGWARNLHAAGVDNLVTMAPVPELYDDGSGTGRSAVDIWVILPKMYDWSPSRVQYCLDKGDEAWSYNCLIQDDYSPKWEIDFAPLNYRIQPGFINQSLDMTGVLYWRADLWTTSPWTNVEGYGPSYPGEGMLLYPGSYVGLSGGIASMRLKWMRDGIDDFDYVEMLKQIGLGDWALQVSRSVGADWSNWTRDPAQLEAARRTLGERLNEVAGTGHYVAVTAGATPAETSSSGVAQLSATAYDSEGHAITSWQWSDSGAGGTFAPSATVQNPSYVAPPNASGADLIVRLSVTASCFELSGTGSVTLTVQPLTGTETFLDVPIDHWAYDEIMACFEAGIVGGYPDSFYRPQRALRRGEMAVFVGRALAGGEENVPPLEGATDFADIPADHWAAKHIQYVVDANIASGYPDGLYHPDWTITRGQMAVFIARAMVDPTGEEGLATYTAPAVATFRDVGTWHWAYRHIEYIAEAGVATGYPDGLYRPASTCTRDQIAVYICRAFGLLPE
jgi:hypothetical protein